MSKDKAEYKIGLICTTIFHYYLYKNFTLDEKTTFILLEDHNNPSKLDGLKSFFDNIGQDYIAYMQKEGNFFDQFDALVSPYPFFWCKDFVDTRAKHVRILYGQAKDLWSYGAWNIFYNLVLVYGKYTKAKLEGITNVAVVGIPKFDHYFAGKNKSEIALLRKKINPDKKTLLYLPTWQALSSFDLFISSIKDLSEEFNLIIKAHHGISYDVSNASLKNIFIFGEDCDITVPLAVTDFVISDYSGAIFESMLLKKPVILLNTDTSNTDMSGKHYLSSVISSQSLSNVVRDILPNTDNVSRVSSIINSLDMEDLLKKQDIFIQDLYSFQDSNASKRALIAIEELVKGGLNESVERVKVRDYLKENISLMRGFELKSKNSDEQIDSLIREIESLKEQNKILLSDLSDIKKSTTWRLGILIGTAIKRPSQSPRVLLALLKIFLRKILPSRIRSLFSENYSRIRRAFVYLKYSKALDNIIKEAKDIKGVIIFPPTVDWNMPLFQRPHQLAMAFAEKGYLFFYCTGNFKEDRVSGFDKVGNNVYVTDQIELLKKIKDPILFISWAHNEKYSNYYDYSFLIYDYIDELDVFHLYGSEMIEQHNRLIKKADIVTATADKLLEEVRLLKKESILSPNAVDYDHFAKKEYKLPKDMRLIKDKKKPIVGYYGALAKWFDYELLKYLATSTDYSFVIIGPDYDKSMHEHGIDKVENIYLLGPKDYKDLPDYAHYFDVAMIPFVVNKITESTSPVKLFEYMAAGCPIVTSNMHECRKYKSVLVAKDKKDFIKKIKEAVTLKSDKKYQDLLKKDALDNTWVARAEDIIGNFK